MHTVMCPDHGQVDVKSSYSSGGSDPYSIEVGTCGCHVMAFSKDDVVVVRTDPEYRATERAARALGYPGLAR